jgi:Uracil-DNA glycosylase
MLIVGLAPGLRGANATGRPFTGDGAGDALYPLLLELGMAIGTYGGHAADGLELVNLRITNAVRCVPPENKPTAAETSNCRTFLIQEINAMPNLRVILALGKLAHDNILKSLGMRVGDAKFAHGATHLVAPYLVQDSYHCSRYNMNTNRLTTHMFRSVLAQARDLSRGDAS